jgi:hypothetical protein
MFASFQCREIRSELFKDNSETEREVNDNVAENTDRLAGGSGLKITFLKIWDLTY